MVKALGASGAVLATGRAVGEKIASGSVRVIADARQLADFNPGEVLVAESTTPDWEPVMKISAGIVTERGGRTCHAAIVARELGIPAVVGAADAKKALKTGGVVTVALGSTLDLDTLLDDIVRASADITSTPFGAEVNSTRILCSGPGAAGENVRTNSEANISDMSRPTSAGESRITVSMRGTTEKRGNE